MENDRIPEGRKVEWDGRKMKERVRLKGQKQNKNYGDNKFDCVDFVDENDDIVENLENVDI